jgi:F-type H+-transporting ATPase subunit delta
MNESKISVRYAKALFLIAEEKNLLEPVKSDMFLISEVLKENSRFRDFLFSPVTRPSERKRILNVAFGDGKIQKVTLNFLEVLVRNNRIIYLEQTARVFFSIYRKFKRIKSATLATATELNETYLQKFELILRNIYKAEMDLTLVKTPEIIGGFVLTVEDQQYDASIAHKLKNLRTALLSENLK